jgi:hypothetical protein
MPIHPNLDVIYGWKATPANYNLKYKRVLSDKRTSVHCLGEVIPCTYVHLPGGVWYWWRNYVLVLLQRAGIDCKKKKVVNALSCATFASTSVLLLIKKLRRIITALLKGRSPSILYPVLLVDLAVSTYLNQSNSSIASSVWTDMCCEISVQNYVFGQIHLHVFWYVITSVCYHALLEGARGVITPYPQSVYTVKAA